jgi:hypothetical protein
MRTRHRHISLEAQALSDADTLFKVLPITPVVLAHRYLAENGVTLRELADKIVGEQRPVHDSGFLLLRPHGERHLRQVGQREPGAVVVHQGVAGRPERHAAARERAPSTSGPLSRRTPAVPPCR